VCALTACPTVAPCCGWLYVLCPMLCVPRFYLWQAGREFGRYPWPTVLQAQQAARDAAAAERQAAQGGGTGPQTEAQCVKRHTRIHSVSHGTRLRANTGHSGTHTAHGTRSGRLCLWTSTATLIRWLDSWGKRKGRATHAGPIPSTNYRTRASNRNPSTSSNGASTNPSTDSSP
jgi:hypothetical protein